MAFWQINNSINNFIKNNKKRFYFGGTVLFLLIAFSSCKKNDDALGLGLIEGQGLLGLQVVDTLSINAKTIPVDTILSDSIKYALLGSYIDPVFGQSTAGFYFQFKPSTSSVDFGDLNNVIIDSTILQLVYTDYYGKPTSLALDIYELTEDINPSSDYYSYDEFTVGLSNKSASNSTNFSYNPSASATDPEHISIALSNSYGDSLINFIDSTTEQSSFLERFKGLYIKPNLLGINQISVGQGGIGAFDLLHAFSKIRVHYHTTTGDTSYYDFNFDNTLGSINSYSNNRSGFEVEQSINNFEKGKEAVYLQPMLGYETIIEFPHLNNLITEGKIVVNRAELICTLNQTDIDDYPAIQNLFIEARISSGKYAKVKDEIDENEGYKNVGGEINSDGEYIFNITRDIQFLLNNAAKGVDLNFGYKLTVDNPSDELPRSIIYGTASAEGKMKLKIAYTKIE